MKIVQVNLTKENALDVLVRDNIYLVRFSEQHGRRGNTSKISSTHPYGISFKNIKNLCVKEIVELVSSGNAALVEVTTEET